MLTEINFDGIVGPSHNYAALSPGNLASSRHLGETSHPRAAALQGIAKMRANLALGLTQGILPPHDRPDRAWLARLATTPEDADPALLARAMSASAMWAANAATVSPSPDTADGRCHLTVANLMTMPHRSHEWSETLAQLRLAFADAAHFAVHDPVPPPFGDEGAANHMRLCASHAEPGVEVFVYGTAGGAFPVRQHLTACEAVARRHGLDPARTIFAQQSPEAIAAGAFHNDVVAVANETVLIAHEQAFADPDKLYADIRRLLPQFEIIEVPAARISLAEAVASYLFNGQLISSTDQRARMTLIVPEEVQGIPAVSRWLETLAAGNGPIERVARVDLRESMANGGGPACLRLRVVADPRTVDPRFLVDRARLDRIADIVSRHWPQAISGADLASPSLWRDMATARVQLLRALDLTELISGP